MPPKTKVRWRRVKRRYQANFRSRTPSESSSSGNEEVIIVPAFGPAAPALAHKTRQTVDLTAASELPALAHKTRKTRQVVDLTGDAKSPVPRRPYQIQVSHGQG